MEKINQNKNTIFLAPNRLWGTAIESVTVDEDGSMWVDNGEYSTRVNYNPFTGEPAPLQMEGEVKERVISDGSSYQYVDYRK